jgi:hypothetical protein
MTKRLNKEGKINTLESVAMATTINGSHLE